MKQRRRNKTVAAVTLAVVLLAMFVGDGGALTAAGPWHAGGVIEMSFSDGNAWECTLGPQVYKPDDRVGALVAKHCLTDGPGAASVVWGRYGRRPGDTYTAADVTWATVGDVAMIDIGGQGTAAASAQILTNHATARVTGFQRNVTAGQTLCFHGRTTGDSCGTVVRQWPGEGAPFWTLDITWGPWNAGGNSGAPVYDPSSGLVAGIMGGTIVTPRYGSQIYFFDINTAEWSLGYPAGSLRPVT